MSNNSLKETFDFLFIGFGAANCLLLIKMQENGLLSNKKIAVIEPNDKEVNDRTFCFWATEKELLDLNLQGLISSKWQQVKVANRHPQEIKPLHYYHIKGIDLYKKAREALKGAEIREFKEHYNGTPALNNQAFEIQLSAARIGAQKVFDGRPPSYEMAKKNQSHLAQSFYGWEVKTTDYRFDTSTMVMMDFEIPQNNACQFMYILPFSADTALFEVTRFGQKRIVKQEAEKALSEYLNEQNFSYTIIAEEKGVIPMSTLKINSPSYGENWVYTGAGANMVKPTTGYAFHNMAIDAKDLAEAMLLERPFIRKRKAARFRFYDNLLLKILEQTPQHGKRIFQDLFRHFSINQVLLFLSEKTPLAEEMRIFSKLPVSLFLKAAVKDLFYRFTGLAPSYLALILTLVSILCYALGLEGLVWLLIGSGFLSVGLSHGALDYLTDKKITSKRELIKFTGSYIVKGALLGLLWLILPDLALVVFVLFSAWHFGQADFKEWKFGHGLNSFLWGLIVLGTVLLFHYAETMEVLRHIPGLRLTPMLADIPENSQRLAKAFLTVFALFFAAYHRSRFMFASLAYLLLSASLPLLASFGIYFVAQHSMHGWGHLKSQLKMDSYRLWLKSLPFSIGGAGIMAIFMLANLTDYLGIFFILLSCLSMPHVMAMHRFYLGWIEAR